MPLEVLDVGLGIGGGNESAVAWPPGDGILPPPEIDLRKFWKEK